MQLGLGSLPQQRCGRAMLRRQALRLPAVPSSARVPAQRLRQLAVRLRALGGEGAGAAPGSSQGKPTGAAGSQPATPDAVIKSARETQLSASELLAEFLQAEDLQDAVAKRVSLLDEAFFTTASTYIALARRDGQPLVENALTEVLRVAAAAKDATLRPEIRLLNALMRATTPAERELLYQQQASTLASDNAYFFTLLARMTSDVEQQAASAPGSNPRQLETLTMLRTIAKEAQQHKPAAK